MTRIRENIARMLNEDFQIDQKTTELLIEKGLLSELGCRNELIRREYKRREIQSKEKQREKMKLADRYFVSVSVVERAIKP